MKKSALFIPLVLAFSTLAAAQESSETKTSEIPVTRKYDAVLKIEGYMEILFSYLGKPYAEKIPVSEYGYIFESEAVEGYKKLAKQNDITALFALGSYYRNNYYIKDHYKTALEYFTKLEKLNFIPGIHSLGYMYYYGYGTERNVQKAIECYEKCALENYDRSCFNLAEVYLDNENRDLTQALFYAEKGLAAENNGDNKKHLAAILVEYFPTDENLDRAEKLFLESLEDGCEESYSNLADFYNSDGPRPDDRKEAYYFRKLLEMRAEGHRLFCEQQKALLPYLLEREKQGDTLCLDDIAFIYSSYNSICPDFKKYYEYTLKSAQAGNPEGMKNLATAYNKGTYFAEDKAKAVYWFKKAYEANPEYTMNLYDLTELYVKAVFGLYDYLDAYGGFYYMPRNYYEDFSRVKEKEAYGFFKKLADETEYNPKEKSEHETARLAVAFCLENGIGTRKNHELAMQYGYKKLDYKKRTFRQYKQKKQNYIRSDKKELNTLLKAAANGSAGAGDYSKIARIYYNFPTWENIEKAYPYFEKAAEMGDSEAMWYLGNFYKRGVYVHYDFNKSMEYYIQSADNGKTNIIETIADAYEYGSGIEQDIDEAIAWYLKVDPEKLYSTHLFRLLLDEELPERFRQKKRRW